MKTAGRVGRLAPNFFAALQGQVTAFQAAGYDVLRLDIGSPDQPPAAHILDALTRAAADPSAHGYGPHIGPLALRQAWADHYRRNHGVTLDPERQVLPLLGSKEGIFHITQALVEPGDLVLIPDPGYQTYTQSTLFAGGQPYFLPLTAERGFLPDLERVPPEALRQACLLWLNYPNNPTGAVASPEFFAAAVDFARRHDLLLVHDAAYTGVTYDSYRAPSVLEVPGADEVAVEFNTLSKLYNMAGWRVGVAVGQAQALASLLALKTHADSGHFLPVLRAATAALNGDQGWLEARNAVYARRRDRLMAALPALGMQASKPKAALYVWAALPPGWSGSVDFVSAVLDAAKVSLTPGTVFGPGGEGYVRFSLTVPDERLDEALVRLKQALPELNRKAAG